MKLFSLGKTRFSIHPMAALAIVVGAFLGKSEPILAYGAALFVHELGHYIASAAFRCPPEHMELTAFGALAAMEGYRFVTPRKQFAIALCGPLFNLLFLLLLMSLFYLNIATAFMMALFKANLLLIVFNLLPILPMDGGRMLQSLLERCIDRQASGRLLANIGMVCGILVDSVAIAGMIFFKTANFSMLITGIYLIYAAKRTKENALAAYLHSIVLNRARLEQRGVTPVSLIAASSKLKVCELMEKLPLGQHVRIIVVDESTLKEMGEVKQEKIEEAILSMPNMTVADLL